MRSKIENHASLQNQKKIHPKRKHNETGSNSFFISVYVKVERTARRSTINQSNCKPSENSKHINLWCSRMQLEFVMNPAFSCFGSVTPVTHVARDLGVFVEEKLSFQEHCFQIVKKASESCFIYRTFKAELNFFQNCAHFMYFHF